MLHRTVCENTEGRDFVVGDIHGMYDQFKAALAEVGFNPKVDRCFSVGDLIDRGPKSAECFELIYEPWFIPVLGNHELLMLDAYFNGKRDLWLLNGGGWHNGWDESLLRHNLQVLGQLPLAITVRMPGGAKIGICHAEPPVTDWAEIEAAGDKAEARATWGRTVIEEGAPVHTKGVVATFHGHTIVRHPVVLGNAFFIDTGSFATKKITLFNLTEMFGRAWRDVA